MKKIVKYFSCFAMACMMLISVGCVTKSDMETLQIERQQDLNRIKQLEAELEESKQQLKDEIERSQSPVRERAADMWAEIQSIRTEQAKLRGDIDTVNLRLDRQVGPADSEINMTSLSEQLKEIEFILENQLQVDLNRAREERTASMTTPPAGEGLKAAEGATTQSPVDSVEVGSPQAGQSTPATPVVTTESTDPAKALYDRAYALYKEGKFEQARSYWAEFTYTFKKHPFEASAVFWQGQCYYKLKDYANATILFEDVIEKHKKSSKFKSALYKAGLCWSFLQKPELAKMRMQEVIKKFPKSVEATQAKRYLEKTK